MDLGSGIRDPGFGKKTYPGSTDPGVKKAPDPGSATLVYYTALKTQLAIV
jgi:hypothetical protein